jgi:hypothetical protein
MTVFVALKDDPDGCRTRHARRPTVSMREQRPYVFVPESSCDDDHDRKIERRHVKYLKNTGVVATIFAYIQHHRIAAIPLDVPLLNMSAQAQFSASLRRTEMSKYCLGSSLASIGTRIKHIECRGHFYLGEIEKRD